MEQRLSDWAVRRKNRKSEECARREAFVDLEYQAVQARLLSTGNTLNTIETAFPVAIGAFYAWVWSRADIDPTLYAWILWVPAAMVILGAIRHFAEKAHMRRIVAYAARIEKYKIPRVGRMAEPLEGFENHYHSGRTEWFDFKTKDVYRIFSFIYWGLMMVGTVGIALVHPAAKRPTVQKVSESPTVPRVSEGSRKSEEPVTLSIGDADIADLQQLRSNPR